MLKPITNIIISSSPFLVTLPFTINNSARFDINEEKALWQPPGYIFGIVWPCLHFLLYNMNMQIFTSNYSLNFISKNKLITSIESLIQGLCLYNFQYNNKINGRTKVQKFKSLINLSMLWIFGLFRIKYFITFFGSFKKSLILNKYYIPYFIWINFAWILAFQLYNKITKN